MIFSRSSSTYKAGTIPVVNMLLISSRNPVEEVIREEGSPALSTFFGYMLIAKHEDDLLVFDTQFVIENFQIFTKVRFTVATAELDFEDFTMSGVCCQTCH